MHSLKIKQKIQLQRLAGISIENLAKQHGIPRGTVYSWVKDVTLSTEAKEKLSQNSAVGRKKGRMTVLAHRKTLLTKIQTRADQTVDKVIVTKEVAKIFCSLLFWAEGAKSTTSLGFINSDPRMVRTFLRFLRQGFTIDESKFRILVHLHSYHSDSKIRAYWSDVTKIPLSQFNRSYQKQQSGKMKKDGYMGCVSIRYYDAEIAKELTWLYTTLGDMQ